MKAPVRLPVTLMALAMLLTACETMEGLGRDTHKLGDNVTGSAKKNDLDNDPKN